VVIRPAILLELFLKNNSKTNHPFVTSRPYDEEVLEENWDFGGIRLFLFFSLENKRMLLCGGRFNCPHATPALHQTQCGASVPLT